MFIQNVVALSRFLFDVQGYTESQSSRPARRAHAIPASPQSLFARHKFLDSTAAASVTFNSSSEQLSLYISFSLINLDFRFAILDWIRTKDFYLKSFRPCPIAHLNLKSQIEFIEPCLTRQARVSSLQSKLAGPLLRPRGEKHTPAAVWRLKTTGTPNRHPRALPSLEALRRGRDAVLLCQFLPAASPKIL